MRASARAQFLGRVLGKALYESILVEPQFAHFFLNKLLGRHNYIDDLYTLDPEVRCALRLWGVANTEAWVAAPVVPESDVAQGLQGVGQRCI